MSRIHHEVPIRCTGIAAVLLRRTDNDHKVLLLKRNSAVLRDTWCYIGGGIEEGEKAWEAALREIREETSITQVVLYNTNKFDQFYSAQADYIYVAPVFVGYVDDDQEVILNHEHSQYEWLTFNEAMDRVSLPGNDEVLAFIEKHFVRKAPSEWLRVSM
ncbi:dATP pyrophosphohydrolase [Paenibacillus cellulosilyticus]|uniref:dATP pyrophosphohydrolase n=1 Tax=Paenibacillus cellulosilyticus TaxID=375489 RepID=A0A2V2YXR0_9BACL|nr:NUDIX domain-containing protein [Paenibacillus cellulosilyticus]PWW06532.1 dATP pyrophosphohydrolase [Paenibacillus cellulosilyticus]QKS46132.1 NUDIX domain-containing protein [Paenibacillus cellulosilyticus]